MFQYNRLDEFGNALARDGQKLEDAYTKLLGPRLDEIIRLISPKLFVAYARGESPVKFRFRNNDSLSEQGIQALINAQSIRLFEECLAQELDARVLKEAGYDPKPWLDSLKEVEARRQLGSDIYQFKQETGEKLKEKTWQEFLDRIRNWTSYLIMGDPFGLNFISSYQEFRVAKIRTDQVLNLDDIIGSGRLLRDEPNGVTYVLPIKPEGRDIKIGENGRLSLKNTSHLVTAPLVVLPEAIVEDEISKELGGYGLSPYLLLLMHEFHHVIIYALQRHPSNFAAVLLENFDKLK